MRLGPSFMWMNTSCMEHADSNSEWYTDIPWWSRIMPCGPLTPDYSCASLSRFILRTVSFNCLLNEGKSSLIRGCLHLGRVCLYGCSRRQRQVQDVYMKSNPWGGKYLEKLPTNGMQIWHYVVSLNSVLIIFCQRLSLCLATLYIS